MLALADRQCDLIELPVGAIGFQRECQRLIIADPLRLQHADAAMKLAGQHGVFAGGDLEIQFVAVLRFGAEMHLGRGEQRDGALVMLNAIMAETVAGNLQSITGRAGQQRPALAATGFAGLNEPVALQLALAIEQIQMLFVGLGLPRRRPAHRHRIRAIRLQIQTAVTDLAPTHGRGEGVQRQAETEQQGQAFHAVFRRCSISHIGVTSRGRMIRVCQNGTPLKRQYNTSIATVTAR